MKGALLGLLIALVPAALSAQISPSPGFDDPRLQTIAYDPAQRVRLVAFPQAPLTVILLPGDRIERATLSDRSAFEVKVVGNNDTLSIAALRAGAEATLLVDTNLRRYEFVLATGEGLLAAYVVRFTSPAASGAALGPELSPFDEASSQPLPMIGEYRLAGDSQLRPSSIGDDGQRTYIEWGEYQSLPAVFGVGPSGEEEVVDGHMRSGVFTIDRVYGELVFRIDRDRARARRVTEPGQP